MGNRLADLFIVSQPPLRQLRDSSAPACATVGERRASLVVDHHQVSRSRSAPRSRRSCRTAASAPGCRVHIRRSRSGRRTSPRRHPRRADHVLPVRIVDVGDDHGVGGVCADSRVSRREGTTAHRIIQLCLRQTHEPRCRYPRVTAASCRRGRSPKCGNRSPIGLDPELTVIWTWSRPVGGRQLADDRPHQTQESCSRSPTAHQVHQQRNHFRQVALTLW